VRQLGCKSGLAESASRHELRRIVHETTADFHRDVAPYLSDEQLRQAVDGLGEVVA
jgi:hypothetical protein